MSSPVPSRPSTPTPPPPETTQPPPAPPYAVHNALFATTEGTNTEKRPYTLPALQPNTTIEDFLRQELSVTRINKIHNYLWLAGPRHQERSLHRQVMSAREIIVCEKIDLHLCWEGKQIYLKPIPTFLLHHDFFQEHLCIPPGEGGEDLYAAACGFLKTYTRLIKHESDLSIAKDAKLVPGSITWEQWCAFSADIAKNTGSMIMCHRYDYGELRLTRLNLLYEMKAFEPFHWGDHRHKHLLDTISFEWLLTSFVYFSCVLTAMQVILATEVGAALTSVQNVSFGFSVFVLAMFAISCVVLGVFVIMRVYMFSSSETWFGKQQYKIYYLDRILELVASG